MRVVLANKFLYDKGGAEQAVLSLGAELERRGHEVFYFGMAHARNAVAGEHVGLVRTRDYHATGVRRLRDAGAMLYSFAARSAFTRLLRRVRPDVVHYHNVYHQLTPAILEAGRDAGVPGVMTLHDYKLVCPRYDLMRHGTPCDACLRDGPTACLRYRCGGSWGASLLLTAEAALHRERATYDLVRLFLAPSRFLLRMIERGGMSSGRIRHVPNFVPALQAVAVAPDPERFVYVGRLSREKGIETLVEAALGLRRGTLVICGAGPMEARIRELAAGAGGARVELRGHLERDALVQEMSAASFVVLPSRSFENAPFAILEAMALGRAVLASRIGGIPELVRPGVTGELLPPGDVAAWRAALQAAIADPERMRRMGQSALDEARQRFGLDRHVDATESIYREVTA